MNALASMVYAAAAWLQQGTQQAIQQAMQAGMKEPTRTAFSAPGSNLAHAAAAESWHAFLWVVPFILLADVLLVVVIVKFRDRGDGRRPATFHENNLLEFAWTVIPAIVVILVALHSFPVLHYMEFGGTNPALNVNVVGHQFFWEYKYPQYGIDISNDTLVVPADQVVDLDLTSVDVIHGFFVPGLGIQEDALPGRVTNLWFKADPGVYKGQCTQLCGENHAQMLIEVQVLPNDQFQAWLQTHRGRPAS
ncbi:MAG: cytochrome c oxidase subunit II, partial [Terriglobales bacterium]